MKYEKRIYTSLFWIFLGLALIICSLTELLRNDTLTALGVGWITCGIFQVIRQIRYRKDKDFRERFDTETNDERNRYISAKAWAWAGYSFVLICGIASVILFFSGQSFIAQIISGGMCMIVALYWISYMVLRKKY